MKAFRLPRVGWSRALTVVLYVAAVLLFLQVTRQYFHKSLGFTELIVFGDQFEPTRLPEVRDVPRFVHRRSSGYDGQWYAQLAVDPLLRSPALEAALDTPPYRARRILFSWTAYLAGAGQPGWILNAFAVQNIAAWLLLAWLLLRWLPPTSLRHFASWAGCLFCAGMAFSFRFALLDGPSMVLIAVAVWAVETRRSWLGAGLLGASGLGREVNVLAAAMLVDRRPRGRHEWLMLAARGLAVVGPLLLWLAYVTSIFPSPGTSVPGNFGVPLSGYLWKWRETLSEINLYGWSSFAPYELACMAGLTVQAGYLLWRREWSSTWWRVGAAYAALMLFLGPVVWEGNPGAYVRVLLPLTCAFNVLIPRSRAFWPLVVLGNLSVWPGLVHLGLFS